MNGLDNRIERILEKEPAFKLPNDFSEKMIGKIEARYGSERKWELILMISGGLLFIIALIVVLALTDFTFTFGALTFLSGNIELIIFGILFITALHFVDKRLLRKHQVDFKG